MKKTIFTRTGKPIAVSIGDIKMQIPGGYSEMDSDIVDKIMATPQSINIAVLSDKDAESRKLEIKKIEDAKAETEKAQKKLDADNLKKMQDALKLHDIKQAQAKKDGEIKALQANISALKETIRLAEKEIKDNEKTLASMTKEEAPEEIDEVKKSKKGGK